MSQLATCHFSKSSPTHKCFWLRIGSLNMLLLWSIFSGVTSSFLERQSPNNVLEWSTGINESLAPWIKSTGHETFTILGKAGSKKYEKEWSARGYRGYQESVYSDHVPEVRTLGDEIMNDITSNLPHWHFIAKAISLIPHAFDILATPTFSPPVFLPTLPTGTSDGFGRRC